MDIRPANANGVAGIYQQNMSSAKAKDTVNTSVKQDVIAISEEGLKMSGIGKVARSIASEVDTDVSSERIASLRSAVENGTYSVSSESIADAILKRVSV